jgi:hypothetical protein
VCLVCVQVNIRLVMLDFTSALVAAAGSEDLQQQVWWFEGCLQSCMPVPRQVVAACCRDRQLRACLSAKPAAQPPAGNDTADAWLQAATAPSNLCRFVATGTRNIEVLLLLCTCLCEHAAPTTVTYNNCSMPATNQTSVCVHMCRC